jgi:hypothetical protein
MSVHVVENYTHPLSYCEKNPVFPLKKLKFKRKRPNAVTVLFKILLRARK